MFKKFFFLFLFLLGPFWVPTNLYAVVRVFTCEPEWKSLAQEIGQKEIQIYSATNSFQDPHYVKAKPSLIAKVRRADLIICTGADLEVGWLPVLLQKSGNSKVQPNALGYFLAADFVELKDQPQKIDRSMGDIHPMGNPHIHLNPHNITKISIALSERLQKIDSQKSKFFQKNEQIFLSKWKKSIEKWEKESSVLKGMKMVVYHRSWFYLVDWLQLDVLDAIELKSGIKPTAQHLKNLLQKMKQQPVRAIIRTPYESKRSSVWLSKKTQVPQFVLPYTVSEKTEKNLFELFDNIIAQLKEVK